MGIPFIVSFVLLVILEGVVAGFLIAKFGRRFRPGFARLSFFFLVVFFGRQPQRLLCVLWGRILTDSADDWSFLLYMASSVITMLFFMGGGGRWKRFMKKGSELIAALLEKVKSYEPAPQPVPAR